MDRAALLELGIGLIELGIDVRISNARRTVLARVSGLVNSDGAKEAITRFQQIFQDTGYRTATILGIQSIFLRILETLSRPCLSIILVLTGVKTKVLNIFWQKKSISTCLARTKIGCSIPSSF